MLARRLVGSSSASDDAESVMISKLKVDLAVHAAHCYPLPVNYYFVHPTDPQAACGTEYTSKLQRMFNDIGLSKDFNAKFKDHLDASRVKLSMDFSVYVLTSGSWPFQSGPAFTLPSALVSPFEIFTTYYTVETGMRSKMPMEEGDLHARD